jgi:broad specificity phosphatase PhoE
MTVKLYLVRHGKAGSRSAWQESDDLRPLSKPGRRQADALADAIGDKKIARVVSSPFVRCRQTVEPLAERVHVPVDLSDALAEGASLTDALRLIEKVAHESTVLCSHGDVLGLLLQHHQDAGVALDDDRLEKGSVWVLTVDGDGGVNAATYLAPPL